jgi:hypothetical protein
MFYAELEWDDSKDAWVLRTVDKDGIATVDEIFHERDASLWDLAIHTSMHAPEGVTGRVFVHKGWGHEIWLVKGHVDFVRTV